MSYKVKRWMGYQPWGVTNPWVFANYGQPQRHRGYVSPIIFQTEPPKLMNHHLGQLVAPPPTATPDAHAVRMEKIAITGLVLSGLSLAIYLYTVRKVMLGKNPRKRKKTRRVHLLMTRGGETACGADGQSSADINFVTCPACTRVHDRYEQEQGF